MQSIDELAKLRDDIRMIANRALARGPDARHKAALGLIEGMLVAGTLPEKERFLLEVAKILLADDNN